MNEFYKKFNVVGFPSGNTGAQMGGWFRKEIKTVADVQGLKMRIGGIAGQVMQKLGAVPQQIAGGDIYPALEKGTIDGAEWVAPTTTRSSASTRSRRSIIVPAGGKAVRRSTPSSTAPSSMNCRRVYQAALINASAYANTWMQARYDIVNPEALRRLVGDGAQLRLPAGRDGSRATRPRRNSTPRYSAKNPDFKKAIEAMTQQRANGYLWWQVAVYTFDNFMIRATCARLNESGGLTGRRL